MDIINTPADSMTVLKGLAMDHIAELKNFLDSHAFNVRQNVEIVKAEDFNHPRMLHISADPNIKTFIPRIGARQMKNEDRTVPRLCVCPHLYGCFIGYWTTESDLINLKSDGKEPHKWLGGYTIYALPFELALRPNKKLVMDEDNSDEHWLVAYGPDVFQYIPQKVGKCFIKSVTYSGVTKEVAKTVNTLLIEVTDPNGIYLTKDKLLKPGCWEVITEGPYRNQHYDDLRQLVIREVPRAEYDTVKMAQAAMLEHK